MSKDYKPAAQKNSNKGNPFLSGLLVGFLLGVGLSVGVTMYINGTDSPFSDNEISRVDKDLSTKQSSKQKSVAESALPEEENPDASAQNKTGNEFDFYTILPETESTVTEQEVKENSLTVKKDSYFLQVGAFQNEADADNMKAKLALQGFEAVVQTASIPEKGVWHRVRVGPLSDIDQINKIRGDLTTGGFNTDLIKVHTETKSQ